MSHSHPTALPSPCPPIPAAIGQPAEFSTHAPCSPDSASSPASSDAKPPQSPRDPDALPSVPELRCQAHQFLDSILDFCVDPNLGLTFLAFERCLLAKLHVLGCLLIQIYLLRRHELLDHSSWLDKGYRVANTCAWRTLHTLFGPVRYCRSYLIPKKRKGPGIHPLDIEQGLTRDSFSPLLIGWFCRLATRLSFRLASELGGMLLGTTPQVSTVEGWVLGLGRPAHAFLSDGPLPEGDGDVLIIEIDGKAVPTATDEELSKRRGKRQKQEGDGCCDGKCGNGECGNEKKAQKKGKGKGKGKCKRHGNRAARKQRGKKQRRKKGDKSKNGRSAVLVVMYTLQTGEDGKLHGPINKKVYASFGSRQQALKWARAQATRRGFGPETTKTVQIVVDGEICLAKRAKELFPKAIVTLDIRHAQEKLWEVGRLFYKEGSKELTAWVEALEELLFNGEIKKLLEELRKKLDTVPRTGPGTARKRESLGKVIGYLENRIEMMEYKTWQEADLVIASGIVEGAARYVIGERLDNGGMRWIEENAECLLLLRCIEVNGDWDAFWEFAENQRTKELGEGKASQIRSKVSTQPPVN